MLCLYTSHQVRCVQRDTYLGTTGALLVGLGGFGRSLPGRGGAAGLELGGGGAVLVPAVGGVGRGRLFGAGPPA